MHKLPVEKVTVTIPGTAQVPSLDEASWINAANNNDGAAPAFSSYAEDHKL